MSHSQITISYLTLRRLIGIIAILHPVILYVGGKAILGLDLQPSMSDYYWTGMRDIFVGINCAIGVFILCYRGYSIQDHIAAFIAGTAAISVSLFPTPPQHVSELSATQTHIGMVHAASAITFLLAISYFCLVLFVKHDKDEEITPRKRFRNHCYRFFGVVILIDLVFICLYVSVPAIHEQLAGISFVYWMEIIAFWSFGIAWLIKGHALFADKL